MTSFTSAPSTPRPVDAAARRPDRPARRRSCCPTRCSPRPAARRPAASSTSSSTSPTLGAVVTKSIMLEPRSGRADPADGRDAERHAQLDRPAGPGHRRLPRARPAVAARARRARRGVDRRRQRRGVRRAGRGGCAAPPGMPAVEVNISCPNVENRGLVFACDPDAAAAVVGAVRRTPRPRCRCFAKLSPDVTDIVAIARACVDAGADGLSMINTLLGMAIDTRHDAPGARRRHRRAVRAGDQAGRGALHLAGARRAARGADPRHGRRRAPGCDALELVLAGASRGLGRHRDLPRPVRAGAVRELRRARRARLAAADASASPTLADAVGHARPQTSSASDDADRPGAVRDPRARSPSPSTPPTSRPPSAWAAAAGAARAAP